MIGYKIIKVGWDGKLHPMYASGRFKRRGWNRPKKGFGPFCVFREIKNALNFWGTNNTYLWLHHPSPIEYLFKVEYRRSRYEEIWEIVDKITFRRPLKALPEGKDLASSFRILYPVNTVGEKMRLRGWK